MKLAHKIDANGYMIEPVLVADSFVNTSDTIVNICPDGFYKPQWNGTQWVDAQPLTDAQILQQAQNAKIAELSAKCDAAIVGGFPSSALGVAHTYPSDKDAQSYLGDAIKRMELDSTVTNVNFKTLDAGFLAHTLPQLQQVFKDGFDFGQAQITKYNQLKTQVEAATTVDGVNAIVW